MAKLVKHSNDKWYIHYANRRTGRSERISARTSDKGVAKQRLAEFNAQQSKPAPTYQPTIDEIIDYYLTDRKGRVVSHDQLTSQSKHIKRHLGHIKPEFFTKDDNRAYIQARRTERIKGRDESVKDGTIIKELVTLRSALNLAARDKVLPEKYHVELPPSPPARERWLTRTEATKLIDAAHTDHMRLFLMLAIYTGARKTAILQLTWDRVRHDNKVINYRLPNTPETKKRRAVVPTTKKLQAALSEARERAKTPFVIEYRRKPVLNIKHAWKLTLERSGIDHCRPHDLRHTCATWMMQAGVKASRVAGVLATTEKMIERVYGHHSPDYLQDAISALEE